MIIIYHSILNLSILIGVFIMVTYGEPEYRLTLLKDPDIAWHISIYCIAKATNFD